MQTTEQWVAFLAVVGGTSMVSGMVGMLGGMVLLAALAVWFPPAVLIPVHGCIQAMSNGSRVAFHRKSVDWGSVGWFAIGALVGAALGRVGLPSLPPVVLNSLIGMGCLVGVWLPWILTHADVGAAKLARRSPRPESLAAFGALGTFLVMIAGAAGPILDAFVLREDWSKERILGTKAAFQFTSHGLKVVAFSLSGFTIGPWVPVLLAALPVTILGARLGQALIRRVPVVPFLWMLRLLVTGLAVSMLGKSS